MRQHAFHSISIHPAAGVRKYETRSRKPEQRPNRASLSAMLASQLVRQAPGAVLAGQINCCSPTGPGQSTDEELRRWTARWCRRGRHVREVYVLYVLHTGRTEWVVMSRRVLFVMVMLLRLGPRLGAAGSGDQKAAQSNLSCQNRVPDHKLPTSGASITAAVGH